MACTSGSMSTNRRSMSVSATAPVRAASRSSSEKAAAIQVAAPSSLSSPDRSALPTPPADRWVENDPSPRGSKRYGPRWEATIMRLPEIPEEPQPVFELARRQEVATHVVAAGLAHRLGLGRVAQQ